MSFALSSWPHGRDVVTCKRCVEIFLKAVMFNKNLTLNMYLVETYSYMTIFILVYMPNLLKVSMHSEFLLCCRPKVCSDAFVNLFSPCFLQHGCELKS